MLAGRERYSDVQPPRAGCGLEATGLLSLSEVCYRRERACYLTVPHRTLDAPSRHSSTVGSINSPQNNHCLLRISAQWIIGRLMAGRLNHQRLVVGFLGGAMSVPTGESDESSRTVPVASTITPN
jgi:hypothetical protein